MRPKLIVNDVHLGVQRTAGTTPRTSAEIRGRLQIALTELLMQHTDKDVIINGDLFDEFDVPMADVLMFYHTAVEWLRQSYAVKPGVEDGPTMILGAGNHDLAKDSSRVSSLQFIGRVLETQFPGRVKLVMTPQEIFRGMYMIPHLPNQDIFDAALAEAENLENHVIFLHANYDNGFAANSDHSLNVSEDQATRLIKQGNILVFGHEHQHRAALDGNVFVTGNQRPSSVADCMNNPDNKKHAHIIEDDPVGGFFVTPIETWDGNTDFAQIDWQDLENAQPGPSFIRVIGDAAPEQAADAVAAIAKFRQKSDAYVITNAVRVGGAAEMEDLPESIEVAKEFDVLGYLYEQLDPAQADVIRNLLKDAEPMKEAA